MKWSTAYKHIYGQQLFPKELRDGLISPENLGQHLARKAAILCPGSSLSRLHFPRNEYQRVLGINLAAAAELEITDVLFERLSLEEYGNAQYRIIKFLAKNSPSVSIYAKNIWSKTNFASDRLAEVAEFTNLLLDIPLRGGGFLSKNMVLEYLKNDAVGFSNWKSSLFVAITLLRLQGVNAIDIFGIGEPGYFWEQPCAFDIIERDSLAHVRSRQTHDTELGRHKVSDILKAFIDDIQENCSVEINILQ